MNSLKVAIWLDFKKCLIMRFRATGMEFKELSSTVERKHRSTGGVRSKWGFWHRSVASSNRLEERRTHAINDYYGLIASQLQEQEKIFIFGPGEAKRRLKTFLCAHGHSDENIDILENTPSRLSKAQIIARAKYHFHQQAPRLGKSR